MADWAKACQFLADEVMNMNNSTQAEPIRNGSASVDEPARLLMWQKVWDILLAGCHDSDTNESLTVEGV